MHFLETTRATNTPKEIDYRLIHIDGEVGYGSYGTIHKANRYIEKGRDEHTIVALKQLRGVSGNNDSEFEREVNALSALDHTNILKLLGVTRNGDGTRFMIFEYMVNGSLDNWLQGTGRTFGVVGDNRAINELSLADIGLQVADGMQYIASKNIVHRDLAARNILLAEDLRVRIADFGLARDITEKGYYKIVSSTFPLRWTDPLSRQSGKFNLQSDVFSFGVLLWEIFSYGKIPFLEIGDDDEITRRMDKGIYLEKPADCPDVVYELMQECWNSISEKKPSFRNIHRRMVYITGTMLLTPLLTSHISESWTEENIPALKGWNMSNLPSNVREKWGLKNWPLQLIKGLQNENVPSEFDLDQTFHKDLFSKK